MLFMSSLSVRLSYIGQLHGARLISAVLLTSRQSADLRCPTFKSRRSSQSPATVWDRGTPRASGGRGSA